MLQMFVLSLSLYNTIEFKVPFFYAKSRTCSFIAKKIFLKLDSNYSYKRYKEKVTYNFYDDKLEIIRKYDRTIIEWKNITCCNIKKNLCWLGYGNKGLVINGDEFSFGTEEQFITFIKNKNHININLE